MSKLDENLDGNGIPISDDAIRRSLLGCADPREQAQFESLLMTDDRLEQRVQRLELELADDFSFGRLSSTERQLFSNRYLVTTKRARELAVSQALRKAMSRESGGLTEQLKSRWPLGLRLFAFDRPFAGAAFAVAALILFGALFWLLLRTPTVRFPVIAKRPPFTGSEREFAHPVASQTPDSKSSSEPSPIQPRVVASLTLQSDSDSAAKQTLYWSTSAAEQDRVRLDLLVARDTSGTYQARLTTDKGIQVAAYYDLKLEAGSRPKVVLTLPAQLLPTGGYYIDLTRSSEGKIRETHRYSFQVKEG